MQTTHVIRVLATTAVLLSAGAYGSDKDSDTKYWQVHGGGDGGPTLRADASKDSDKVVKNVPNGSKVTRVGDCKKRDGHNWCEVEYEDKRGWIREKYLRKVKNDD